MDRERARPAGLARERALRRRLQVARRIARLEAQEARLRTAFQGASLVSSLAGGAWLARLQELQGQVDERTEALRSESDELEALTYAVSHDMRSPLRHMDAYATLLRQRTAGTLDSRSEGYLDSLGQAAARMGALVDDLLSFLYVRRSELLRSPVEVDAIVRELIEELAPQTAGRDVQWKVGEFPPVEADPRLLRMALANLLSNAVKFTRARPRAAIEVGGSAPPGGKEVVLFVRDNGIGFDAKYAGKLFRVFHRLQRTEEYEGTGIGLAMVRRIVELHGGHVRAESEPGQGATFFVSLPRALGAAAPVAHQLTPEQHAPEALEHLPEPGGGGGPSVSPG